MRLALATLAAGAALAYGAATQRTRVIFEDAGAFGRVRVVEARDGLRTLYTGAGRARQSALYPGRPLHLELAYTRVAAIGLALVAPDARILFVGLGGGAMPTFAHRVLPRARIDVVEIDPLIVDVARRFFGFTGDDRMRVHTGDGRAFIERAPPASWDLIVLDAFADDEVPFALTTREFLAAVRSRLAPAGIVVANLWSGNDAYPSMLATYAAAFEQVHLVRVRGREQRILIAGSAGRSLHRAALARAAHVLEVRAQFGFDLQQLVESGYELLPAADAPVLRDSVAASPVARARTRRPRRRRVPRARTPACPGLSAASPAAPPRALRYCARSGCRTRRRSMTGARR
jgi:spermidine synthase